MVFAALHDKKQTASAPGCADTMIPGAGIALLTCLQINNCPNRQIQKTIICERAKDDKNKMVLPLCWKNWSKYDAKASKICFKK